MYIFYKLKFCSAFHVGLFAVPAVLVMGISLRIGPSSYLLVMFKKMKHTLLRKQIQYCGGKKQNPHRTFLESSTNKTQFPLHPPLVSHVSSIPLSPEIIPQSSHVLQYFQMGKDHICCGDCGLVHLWISHKFQLDNVSFS